MKLIKINIEKLIYDKVKKLYRIHLFANIYKKTYSKIKKLLQNIKSMKICRDLFFTVIKITYEISLYS